MEKTVNHYHASRLIAAEYKSSTLPVLLETDGGTFFVKLVGTAQGAPLLIAEIIVANIAEALGLRVPERVLVHFDETPASMIVAINEYFLQIQ